MKGFNKGCKATVSPLTSTKLIFDILWFLAHNPPSAHRKSIITKLLNFFEENKILKNDKELAINKQHNW